MTVVSPAAPERISVVVNRHTGRDIQSWKTILPKVAPLISQPPPVDSSNKPPAHPCCPQHPPFHPYSLWESWKLILPLIVPFCLLIHLLQQSLFCPPVKLMNRHRVAGMKGQAIIDQCGLSRDRLHRHNRLDSWPSTSCNPWPSMVPVIGLRLSRLSPI